MTYQFSVEEVLFDHDNINSFRVFECEKTESSRPSRSPVSHNSTFGDLTKL